MMYPILLKAFYILLRSQLDFSAIIIGTPVVIIVSSYHNYSHLIQFLIIIQSLEDLSMAATTTTRRRSSARSASRSRGRRTSSADTSLLGNVSRTVSNAARPVNSAVKTVRRSAAQLPSWLVISLGAVALGGLVYATGLGSKAMDMFSSDEAEDFDNENNLDMNTL